ncbi:flagellar biosynthetic protein FliR [Pseudohalioglobus lutimaris]|uniref:Flagellar biosynthetic protein FliR n=1 Tax=Pseudohalioglobus lutimaris TaxID=1737061 RepID=A0A2N5X1E2_9GAMM|nr:flagellar biosynthetic protein FliR [Pseudohalioglobus lutimaris]PLW68307.1 flagellar biosynthetic protein FliR [Pseudohalioglobus lutimaris]
MFTDVELLSWIERFFWPFLRLSALFLAAPIFSAGGLPVRVRIVLAALLAVLVAPALPAPPTIDPLSSAGAVVAAQQVFVGLAMGFLMQMVFAAAVVAGQSLAMTMGLGFAMSVDPQNGVQVPVLSQFYVIMSTLIFLAVDGHLVLIQALVQSFTLFPVGDPLLMGQTAMNVVYWGSQLFASALLLALPALTAILLINLAFGVITRASPQLNIFAVGFPVTILAGFIFIFLSLPVAFSLFIELFDESLAQTLQLFR